ncbi:metallophosphoesterase [uncultured Shewanella sp.]|uniref:metallophosphoesterase n=1 Tax=uncultured Shewanella sp. TaxID=173975 RepID=UPI0026160212|nr:metallophosphoesterase [uncultured Shewanella sp.]
MLIETYNTRKMTRQLMSKFTAIAILTCVTQFSQARPDTFINPQETVIAIGDLHGDLNAMLTILRSAQLIDDNNNWIGNTQTLVQVGDILDRGDDEKEMINIFETLIDQAKAVGGDVIVLNGNHETMNVDLDFRYVTDKGFSNFQSLYEDHKDEITDPDVLNKKESERGRAVAFKPAGDYAQILATHNSVVVIGKTVYVHGGITPEHADYGLDAINNEVSAWMQGIENKPSSVSGSGPLWNRDYGYDVSAEICEQLETTLEKLNATRMVIAHTRQDNINQVCNGKVWRIDTSMSSYYSNGKLQALKITNDDHIEIIEEDGSITDTGFGGISN